MRVVLIIEDAHRAEANALAEIMGWGPDNYSVALSPTGTGPATHWGLSANAGDTFAALIEGAKVGSWPQGVTPMPDMIAALQVHFNADPANVRPKAHWAAVLMGQGLVRVP